jgi:hypothetical protein
MAKKTRIHLPGGFANCLWLPPVAEYAQWPAISRAVRPFERSLQLASGTYALRLAEIPKMGEYTDLVP